MEEIVRRYFRLVNEEKFDDFFDLFLADVEFHTPFNFHAQGLENVKPYYLRVPLDFPEHVDTPEKIMVSGNEATVFIDFKAKTRAGLPIAFKAVDWFVFEGGKIKSLHVFFDSFHLARVLAGK